MRTVEDRVETLEELMEDLIKTQKKTELEIQELKKEMKEFKNEMREFKEEMRKFKDEMKEFKDWTKASIENLNRELGRIANKFGTLVEDIIEPAFDRIVKKYFGCESYDIASNIRRRSRKDKSKIKEIDVLVECDEIVIVNETKSNPNHSNVKEFVDFVKSGEFIEYFPEFKDKNIVYIFSSLNIPVSEINYLTKNGIYAMHMSGPYMEIVNFNEVNKRK